MPSFADLLSQRLRSAYPDAASALLGRYGISLQVKDRLRKRIEKNWKDLPLEEDNIRIIASDGSMMRYHLRDGSRLIFARAIAVGIDEEVREIDFGVAFGKKTDITFFQEHLSQLLEIRAIKKLIKMERPEYALIDGSLMTLLSNLPIEIKIRALNQHSPLSFQSFSVPPSGLAIALTKEIIDLINTAREHKTVILGISKDSSTSYLQNLLLDSMNIAFLNNYSFSSTDYAKLVSIYHGITKDPMNVIAEFTKFGVKRNLDSDQKWQELLELLLFRIYAPCDTAMLNFMAPNAGYSMPIELSATRDQKKVINLWSRSQEQFIDRNFSRTVGDIPIESRGEFNKMLQAVIMQMDRFETVITTYVRFEDNSLPIRLDLLASDAGIRANQFFNVEDPHFVNITPQIEKAIAIARAGYVSDQIHNIMLWKADNAVKMKRSETGIIYLDIIEQETLLSRFEFLSRREIRDIM